MEILKEKHACDFEVRLSGRLDANQALVLDTELQEVVRSEEHRIRLNMADVGYISSAGIRVLIKHAKMLRSLGGWFQIDEPSQMVAEVISMTGLGELFGTSGAAAPAVAGPATDGEVRKYGDLRCTVYRGTMASTLSCRLIGDPRKLGREPFSAMDAASISIPTGRFALGLGALGTGFEDCQSRYGEFLAAGGGVACLPSGEAITPDYLVATGTLVPEIRVLYAMVGDGSLPFCVRFESEAADAGVRLSEIVRAALDIADAETIGLVLLAEAAGLIGASLRHSPALSGSGSGLFEHPGIRRWISLTPERVCSRDLALVAGFATASLTSELAPFVRPLAEPAHISGHFHAAAFSYRALAEQAIPLQETVASLFDNQTLNTVLHLLNDSRPISGAGESLFIRGAMWIGAVESVATDLPAEKDNP